MKTIGSRIVGFLDRYSIIVAAVVIYGWYLLTSIDLLRQPEQKRTFLDYLLQFDSLILLWIIAVVVIQLQKYRKEKREQEEYRRTVETAFERQRMHLQLLDDITRLLHDNVNNPLAIISITTHSMRRKFEGDEETSQWLDRIDQSMQKITTTINDIKAYQTQKIVQNTTLPSTARKPVAV